MISNIFVGLVVALHIFFLVLEMFLWTKPFGLKFIKQNAEKAKATKVMAKNQGLYNGFLAAGLIWGMLHPEPEIGFQIQVFFLACVIIAGIYGGLTASRGILYIQAIPGIIAAAILFCV